MSFAWLDLNTAERSAIVLRESIRVRCEQTAPALRGLFIVACVVIASVWSQVAAEHLLLWVAPLLLAVAWRLRVANRIYTELPNVADGNLAESDRKLRISSMLNQAAAGSGMWSVAQHGTHEVALFMTLASALYAVGAMINLASDYRSFRASLPLVMGQPCLYWIIDGGHGWGIAATLILLSVLMLGATRHSETTFAESVLMRFEKAALLEAVEAERARVASALLDADAANRAKSAFLAAASHDLRQPLYAISLLADTLAYQTLDDTGRTIVARQQQAIGLLRGLFDNLLDLSKFEAGKVTARLQTVPVDEIATPLLAQFAPLAEQKGLELSFDTDSAAIRTDPGLLQRLLGNLLSNAIRYTHKGYVRLEAHVLHKRIVFAVRDSGPGIDAGSQSSIFEAFVQLDNMHRTRDGGIGLGLAIARRISEVLDAGLQLESAPGSGSTFRFSVPLSETRTSSIAAVAQPPRAGLRVWVLEDDQLVADALSHQFQAWQLNYRLARSTSEINTFLAEAQQIPEAVILDDMVGPCASGLELAHSLKERMESGRILIVTGNTDPRRLLQIADSGFAHFPKPVRSSELAAWLAQIA